MGFPGLFFFSIEQLIVIDCLLETPLVIVDVKSIKLFILAHSVSVALMTVTDLTFKTDSKFGNNSFWSLHRNKTELLMTN